MVAPAVLGAALQTLRANPLHTLLSTLGVVIGVGALVAILALGDGLERYARTQISETSTLEYVQVTARTTEDQDGIRVRIDEPVQLTRAQAQALRTEVADLAMLTIGQRQAQRLHLIGDTAATGVYLEAIDEVLPTLAGHTLQAGRFLTAADVAAGRRVLVASDTLAKRLGVSTPEALVGRQVVVQADSFEVVGVAAAGQPQGRTAYIPFGVAPELFAEATPPSVLLRAQHIEDVGVLQARVEAWLAAHVEGGADAFDIATNAFRAEQAREGILLFKLVMGLITGISVVVGGIGIMNVLLVSITERTREIGVRKATGARRGDVLVQFLVEAVAISLTGSVLGVALGIATVWGAMPLIRHVVAVPFAPALSGSTVAVVATLALVVGLVFGTYPALRAARLQPIEALRHE